MISSSLEFMCTCICMMRGSHGPPPKTWLVRYCRDISQLSQIFVIILRDIINLPIYWGHRLSHCWKRRLNWSIFHTKTLSIPRQSWPIQELLIFVGDKSSKKSPSREPIAPKSKSNWRSMNPVRIIFHVLGVLLVVSHIHCEWRGRAARWAPSICWV